MISLFIVITITLAPVPAQFDAARFNVDTFATEDQQQEVGVWDQSKWDECAWE